MAEQELLTVAEVAERLRVSEETVRRWLRTGRLRGIRLPTERVGWRIPASVIDDLLQPKQLPLEGDEKKAAA